MSTQNDGGPAFPVLPSTMITYADGGRELKIATLGMTLRDYFAAAALSGLLANQKLVRGYLGSADDAYEFADAMLKRRTKTMEAQS